MSDFERAINRFRTIADNHTWYDPMLLLDDLDGKTRATIITEHAIVTILSEIPYSGDPTVIKIDDLKLLKRVDNIKVINGSEWVGDVTVAVENSGIKKEEFLSPVEFSDYNKQGLQVTREEIDYLLDAVTHDVSRPVLECVLFDQDCMVSTDGFRLHIVKGDYNNHSQFNRESGNHAIINYQVLDKIKNDFTICHFDNYSVIETECYNHRVLIKAVWVKGLYPDYNLIVPKSTNIEFTMPFDNRIEKIYSDKFAIVSVDGSNASIKSFENQYVMNKDRYTEFTIKLSDSDLIKPIQFGLNPKFLYDAMRKGDAKIGYNADNAPIIINSNKKMMAIIMPHKFK